MTISPVNESRDPVGSSANKHLRLGDHPTRQRDALRLSTGHLSGTVTFQAIELQSFEPCPSDAQSLMAASAPQQEWKSRVLFRREFGHQLAELEDKTETVSSHRTPLFLAHRVEAFAVDVNLARVGDEDAGQAVEQGRLARAARAHHRQDLTLFHDKIRPTKGWRLPEREDEVPGLEDRAAHERHFRAGRCPHDTTTSANAGRRAAVTSIQRRSASRWKRP